MTDAATPQPIVETPGGGGLRRVLKVRHAVITSLAVITPAGAILFLPIPIAAFAGPAMPLALVFAFVVILVIMNAVYRFAQHIAHAGSFFAFVRDSLGIEAGFFAGWLFLAFYPVLVGLDMILFGATLNGIIIAHGGPDIPWWLLMLVGLVLIWGIAVLGIRLSVRSDLVLLTFEFGVLLSLAFTILAKGAPGGNWHGQVFDPSSAPGGFGNVAVAAVFGVLAFTGFEAPTYLGEEMQNPRRTVPRALLDHRAPHRRGLHLLLLHDHGGVRPRQHRRSCPPTRRRGTPSPARTGTPAPPCSWTSLRWWRSSPAGSPPRTALRG